MLLSPHSRVDRSNWITTSLVIYTKSGEYRDNTTDDICVPKLRNYRSKVFRFREEKKNRTLGFLGKKVKVRKEEKKKARCIEFDVTSANERENFLKYIILALIGESLTLERLSHLSRIPAVSENPSLQGRCVVSRWALRVGVVALLRLGLLELKRLCPDTSTNDNGRRELA